MAKTLLYMNQMDTNTVIERLYVVYGQWSLTYMIVGATCPDSWAPVGILLWGGGRGKASGKYYNYLFIV